MPCPAAHTPGDAAPSHSPPERAPIDCNAHGATETANPGALAHPANKPFSSDQPARRLLAAVSSGDRAAFRELYFLYFLRLANFLSQVAATSASADVEELIVEVMLRIWQASAALAREESVHVSIMRIAYACGCERVAADGHPGPVAARPSSRNLSRDARPESPWQSLHRILAVLPTAERAVVHLVYSGHSRPEVADILGLSCESVDAYLASSRISLRPWLTERSAASSGLA